MLGTDGKKSANFDKEMIKDLTTKKDDMKDMLLINKFDKPKVNYICRICLSEEFDVDLNPLIHPCKCSGTMKYIHLICLKSWFKSKINVKVFNNLTLFNFRELHCELCSASIPDYIKIKEEVYDLIEIDKPETNHILFENIRKNNNKSRNIYLYNLGEKKTINIGSLDHSDIIIKDSSVSNNHAYMSIHNDCLYLSDNNSKYGTLVLIQNDILLLLNKTFSFQHKDIIVSLKLKEKNCFYNCFHKLFKNTVQNKINLKYKDYSDYLEEVMTKIKDENLVKICSFYNYKNDNYFSHKQDEIVPQHDNSREASEEAEESGKKDIAQSIQKNVTYKNSSDKLVVKINSTKIQFESKINLNKGEIGENNVPNITNQICLTIENPPKPNSGSLNIRKRFNKKIRKRINNQISISGVGNIARSSSFRRGSKNVLIYSESTKDINSA